MPITLRDVALRAGVSRAAVSRVFTPGASVSPAMRDRVMHAAEALGYAPNVLASALTTGRTKLIGLVVTNFRNPLFLNVFDLFTQGLQDRGLRPLIFNLSGGMDQRQALTMLRRYAVDGVIISSSTLPPGFALDCQAAGLRVVHAFGRPTPGVAVVGPDNRAAGRLAAQTLRARGYTRIGFLGGPPGASSTQDRLSGVRDILGSDLTLAFADDYAFDAGRAAMAPLLDAPGPDAWFCGDDVIALGALSAIRDRGLRVPQDIGLLGMNDMDMAGWPGIALTTLHQPVAAIIAAAIDLVTGDGPAETRLFPCPLVERGTLRRP
jgi:DNA-binding LacI/PurR family transcriptional regulator